MGIKITLSSEEMLKGRIVKVSVCVTQRGLKIKKKKKQGGGATNRIDNAAESLKYGDRSAVVIQVVAFRCLNAHCHECFCLGLRPCTNNRMLVSELLSFCTEMLS